MTEVFVWEDALTALRCEALRLDGFAFGLGDRLVLAFDAAVERIALAPTLGARLPLRGRRNLRFRPLLGFRSYFLVFENVGERVEVLRFVDGRTDWRPGLLAESDRPGGSPDRA